MASQQAIDSVNAESSGKFEDDEEIPFWK
jgi:hypothetical protein